MTLNWQDKLRTLIQAHEQGHPLVRIYFSYSPPLETGSVDATIQEMALELDLGPEIDDLIQPLRDLYKITDGLVIDVGLTIFALENKTFGILRSVNDQFLDIVQDMVPKDATEIPMPVKLIFGSDEAGDFLCLSDDGSIIRVGHDAPEAPVIANSLGTFLDDLCMGPGFIRYYGPTEGDLWVSILTEFGFI
ncbi:MAG: SMI1/KNR4 family protein [Chloroflexota bacterium]|nr:SMI1/KNR4 family protein [Chloroflexota bacterium]